jgi:hypothetical protein
MATHRSPNREGSSPYWVFCMTAAPQRLFTYDLIQDVCILTLLAAALPALVVLVAVVLICPNLQMPGSI